MTRYFLHLRDGTDVALDEEGSEHSSLQALQDAVLSSARDCIAGDAKQGVLDLRLRIDAEDECGALVHSLAFKNAVAVFQ